MFIIYQCDETIVHCGTISLVASNETIQMKNGEAKKSLSIIYNIIGLFASYFKIIHHIAQAQLLYGSLNMVPRISYKQFNV